MSSGHRTFLLYLAATPDPAWDGTYARMVDPAAERTESLAIVEVQRCYAYRFGGPNDEVFDGHPLARSGLDGYGAYRIENSNWIAEQKAINRVHPQYSEASWAACKHYFLAFHDEVFECLAEGFVIERLNASFAQALKTMLARL